jgi:DNA-binding MarR family transcriptional regulator
MVAMTRKRVAELADHLGYWLRFVSNQVSHSFARRLEQEGVAVGEWVVMRTLLDREPTMSSRIAEELGMTRGAITKLADRMLAKGWIARRPSPDDGRVQMLALTPAGRGLVPRLAAIADRNDELFFRHLSAAERRTLERLMRKLVEKAGIGTVPTD